MNTYKLSDEIKIALFSEDGNPVQGLILKLVLFADEKNNYSIILFPSDANGKVNVSLEYLKNSVDSDRELFLMDYATPFENLAENCQLSLLASDEIENAINAYETYKEVSKYPENYLTWLKEAQNNRYNTFKMMTSISKLIKGEKIIVFPVVESGVV